MNPLKWMLAISQDRTFCWLVLFIRGLDEFLVVAQRAMRWGIVCLLVITLGLSAALPTRAENYDKEELQGQTFAGRDLSKASFVKANLRQADLSNISAAGVSMFGANLTKANLQQANLRAATLDMADMTGADLRDAVLESSMMWLTRLDGANIEGADFTDALLRSDAQAQLCRRASGVNPETGRSTRDTLDCE